MGFNSGFKGLNIALDGVSRRTHRIATLSSSIRSSVLQPVTCSQHSSSAMADVVDVNTRQRMVTELLTAEGSGPIEVHRRLRSVCGEDAVEISSVKRWLRRFNP